MSTRGIIVHPAGHGSIRVIRKEIVGGESILASTKRSVKVIQEDPQIQHTYPAKRNIVILEEHTVSCFRTCLTSVQFHVSPGMDSLTANGFGQVSRGQDHEPSFCTIGDWAFCRNMLRLDGFKQGEVEVRQMSFEIGNFLTKSARWHAETVTMTTRLTSGDFSNPNVGVQQHLQKKQGENARRQEEDRQHLDDDGLGQANLVVSEMTKRWRRCSSEVWVNDKDEEKNWSKWEWKGCKEEVCMSLRKVLAPGQRDFPECDSHARDHSSSEIVPAHNSSPLKRINWLELLVCTASSYIILRRVGSILGNP